MSWSCARRTAALGEGPTQEGGSFICYKQQWGDMTNRTSNLACVATWCPLTWLTCWTHPSVVTTRDSDATRQWLLAKVDLGSQETSVLKDTKDFQFWCLFVFIELNRDLKLRELNFTYRYIRKYHCYDLLCKQQTFEHNMYYQFWLLKGPI